MMLSLNLLPWDDREQTVWGNFSAVNNDFMNGSIFQSQRQWGIIVTHQKEKKTLFHDDEIWNLL